jgi:hypothetical protein
MDTARALDSNTETRAFFREEAERVADAARALNLDDVPRVPYLKGDRERDARRSLLIAYQRVTAYMAGLGVMRRAETWRAWADVISETDDAQDFRTVQRRVYRRLKALNRWGVIEAKDRQPDLRRPDGTRRYRHTKREGRWVTVGGGTVSVTLAPAQAPAQNTGTKHRHKTPAHITSTGAEKRAENPSDVSGHSSTGHDVVKSSEASSNLASRVESGEHDSGPARLNAEEEGVLRRDFPELFGEETTT